MNRIIKKLDTLQNNYNKELDKVIEELSDKIGFEFFLTYQESDGCFMVVRQGYNAPLNKCIEVINEKGFLDYNDYLNLTV